MPYLYADHNRTYRKALRFCAGIGCAAFLSLACAFHQMPAIVLGSEMNADGSVEYLCLGAGCETLPAFYWTD